MKKIIVVFMLMIPLLISCQTETLQKNKVETTEEGIKISLESGHEITLAQIKVKITSADDAIWKVFSNGYGYDNDNVWYTPGGGTVIAYAGDNSIEYVMEEMEKFCSEKAAKILLEKTYRHVNEKGEVGLLLADGEETYSEYDESDIMFLKNSGDFIDVLVTRHCDEFTRNFIYTFKAIGDNFIIDDIQEQLKDGSIVDVHGVW